MANTIDEVIQWAKVNPLYTYKDGSGRKKSWAGLCEAFVNNAGDFDESFGSALIAGNASGPLNGEWAKAPRGAIHYWAGVGGDGHVAFELGGGTLLMASSRTSNYGTALGTIHFLDYGLPLYRGWTMRHGTQTLAGVAYSAASVTSAPLNLTPKDRTQDVETIRRSLTGDIFNIWPEGIKHLNTGAQSSIAPAVQYENDKWHELDEVQFSEFVDSYAIQRGHVYGLGDSQVGVGHVWSIAGEISGKLDRLLTK